MRRHDRRHRDYCAVMVRSALMSMGGQMANWFGVEEGGNGEIFGHATEESTISTRATGWRC